MGLDLHDLEVPAGSFRLGPLALTVASGEYLVMLGPTGAGKTLTLETIAGLRTPSAGRIGMDGRDITAAPPESRRVGFLYQDASCSPI
jgi:ABC-type sugar transport system ATPase subunit